MSGGLPGQLPHENHKESSLKTVSNDPPSVGVGTRHEKLDTNCIPTKRGKSTALAKTQEKMKHLVPSERRKERGRERGREGERETERQRERDRDERKPQIQHRMQRQKQSRRWRMRSSTANDCGRQHSSPRSACCPRPHTDTHLQHSCLCVCVCLCVSVCVSPWQRQRLAM